MAGGDNGAVRTPSKHQSNARILLVEDHEDTLVLLSKLLGKCGYKVSTASTVNDAIRQLEESRFDIVVSDIGLPDGSGCEIMSHEVGKVKGIAISGFGSLEDVKRSKASGFLHHLTKPVDFQQLRAVLEQVEASEAA